MDNEETKRVVHGGPENGFTWFYMEDQRMALGIILTGSTRRAEVSSAGRARVQIIICSTSGSARVF